MLRIGLTGGIGSGKSTVAAVLMAKGATLIDTDAIARSLTLPGGPAMEAITALFGAPMKDSAGGLDRARMRDLVFSTPSAKAQLESILHPMIGAECDRQVEAAPEASAIVFDVPLLVESGRWRARVNKVLVVDAFESTQVRRVLARSGWKEQAVLAVIAQQASRAFRRAAADAVIFNETLSMEELGAEVETLLHYWTARTAR
jgi:dephospho-CoA kinase